MKKITAINGSYRRGGMIDQAVEEACAAARAGGAEVTVLRLADKRVEFCTNCRSCCQLPGAARGRCPLEDDMTSMLDQIEASDGLVIGAPVNFYNVNALTRRFMERLVPYSYWPWGAKAPAMRSKAKPRRAVLITSAGIPSFFGRLATGALRALKAMAEVLGARTEGTLFIGMASMEEHPALSAWDRRLAAGLGRRLLR